MPKRSPQPPLALLRGFSARGKYPLNDPPPPFQKCIPGAFLRAAKSLPFSFPRISFFFFFFPPFPHKPQFLSPRKNNPSPEIYKGPPFYLLRTLRRGFSTPEVIDLSQYQTPFFFSISSFFFFPPCTRSTTHRPRPVSR